jgi:hypothetical protein
VRILSTAPVGPGSKACMLSYGDWTGVSSMVTTICFLVNAGGRIWYPDPSGLTSEPTAQVKPDFNHRYNIIMTRHVVCQRCLLIAYSAGVLLRLESKTAVRGPSLQLQLFLKAGCSSQHSTTPSNQSASSKPCSAASLACNDFDCYGPWDPR